ncbi:conserved hypothetical protein [Talaromyces stipitatus ATCC 10500]|uniref:Uncharacterized protein n=1 Tax=Talaromyces stipitatus (strain ATCC 10500 / CBS 375.48 / QM 6759 / NRRL 1006) TaxID=441959 RepID=B8MLL3_TALSN|nr:uncharacterized protein TSTA_049840 [Talaromyces stipitatus ATCC 10500]EED15546.1 conserved hypothetical protein [Talaromyces stipitatus ATCC 10500]
MPKQANIPVELRVQVVTLVMVAKMKPQDVTNLLGLPLSTVYEIIKRAKARGFDPDISPRVEHAHVIDLPRSGRPKTITPEIEDSIVNSITKDRAGREKSAEYLSYEAVFE